MGAAEPGHELPSLRENWPQLEPVVRDSLVGVQRIFDDTDALEKTYGLKCITSTPSGSLTMTKTRMSASRFWRMQGVFETSIQGQPTQISSLRKTTWAVRNRKKFDGRVASLAFFLDILEKLGDRLNVLDVRKNLLDVRVRQIKDISSITLLKHDSTQSEAHQLPTVRPAFAGERTPVIDTGGHTCTRNVIKDRARRIQGDVPKDGSERTQTRVSGKRAIGGLMNYSGKRRFCFCTRCLYFVDHPPNVKIMLNCQIESFSFLDKE